MFRAEVDEEDCYTWPWPLRARLAFAGWNGAGIYYCGTCCYCYCLFEEVVILLLQLDAFVALAGAGLSGNWTPRDDSLYY